jgi:hypothetical protein
VTRTALVPAREAYVYASRKTVCLGCEQTERDAKDNPTRLEQLAERSKVDPQWLRAHLQLAILRRQLGLT